jgi:hypothetical protein
VTVDRLRLEDLEERAWSLSRDADDLIADVAELGVPDSEYARDELERAAYRLATLLGAAREDAPGDESLGNSD